MTLLPGLRKKALLGRVARWSARPVPGHLHRLATRTGASPSSESPEFLADTGLPVHALGAGGGY